MSKKSIYRVTMLIAGFIAVCAILLSPGFSQKPEKKIPEKETVFIQAPADAIPGNAVKIDQPEIPLLSQTEEKETKDFIPQVTAKVVTKYFKLLLRTLIAPNAP